MPFGLACFVFRFKASCITPTNVKDTLLVSLNQRDDPCRDSTRDGSSQQNA